MERVHTVCGPFDKVIEWPLT